MKLSPESQQRVDEYLRAVSEQLADKNPAVREEILRELRDHLHEALRRQAGDSPSIADVERVLAEMDSPERYRDPSAEAAADRAPQIPQRERRSASSRWFLLALAFLVVNTYGVWKLTQPRGPATPVAPEPPQETAVEKMPLKLLAVEQVNLSAEREATLRLVFNAPPNRDHLAKYLALSEKEDPELSYEMLGSAGERAVLIKTETLNGDVFTVRMKPGLPSASPEFLPGEAFESTVALQTFFKLEKIETTSPSFGPCELTIRMNARAEILTAASFISIEPAVKFSVAPDENYWRSGFKLSGDFKPGAIYTITLKAGLRAENGWSLDRDVTRTIQFPDRTPGLQFVGEGRYLSPRGSLQIPVEAVNVNEMVATLRPVFPNNLVQLALRESGEIWIYGDLTERLTGREAALTNTLSLRPNEKGRTAINLRDLSGTEPRGVYVLELSTPKFYGGSRLLVVTDLGLAARVAPGAILVWVNSLRDAAPVGGAEVLLYSENNQEIARALTDADGLAMLPAREDDLPLLIAARKDGDLSYLDLRRTKVNQGEGLGGAPYTPDGALEAAVFTERGVYRPGETVFLQALVRDRKLNAPEPFPVLFRIRRPDGRVFKDIPVKLDPFGSAQTQVTMPDYLPTGRYELELAMPGTFTVLGETTIALEDFVPPQIRVALESADGRLAAGEDLVFRVKSEHLFGRPSSGLKARGFVTFKAAPFSPPTWPGWTFGDSEKSFPAVYRQLGTNVLDEEGRCEFTAETSDAWRPPAALQAVQQVVVSEAGGRTVSAYGSSIIDVYPFYIGLKLPVEGTLRVGEAQRVSVVKVAPDGSPVSSGKPLLLRLARVHWNSALKKNSEGRYEWKSEQQLSTLREDTIQVGGEAQDWSFTPDQTGEYLLTASDPASGASTSIRFAAAGAGQDWVEWSREKPDRVELALDRARYRPGDTARLMIRAPFAGTALLTIESDRILDRRVIRLEKNTAEIEVPVLADYSPNVYCTLTLIRPAVAEAVWSAHRAVGATSLAVEPVGRRISVSVSVPATNRPQSRLPIEVIARDEQGHPVSGDVTLMAVDEAICMLTSFESPDPMRTFLAQRQLSVQPYDLYHELMPIFEDAVQAASRSGGDDASALRKRLNPIKANRFKPLARWQTQVRLDSNGVAVAGVDLPEFSGELRVMAVAYNAAQIGATQAHVKVKRDLIVQSSLPRFLASVDSCVATLDVFNEGAAPAKVKVRVTCGGPLQTAEPEYMFVLEPGAVRKLALPLVAGELPGKALCTIEVQGGQDVFRDTIEIAVRPSSGLQAKSVFRVLKPGEKLAFEPPVDWLKDSVSAELIVSDQPELKLGRALEYVLGYPYGCLEQTISGAFPLLYAADIANRILPKSAAREDYASFIQAGMLRALSMQQADGSFALWPYQRTTDRAATLYAAHFLVEANRAGYPPPPERLSAALAWLRERLDRAVVTDAEAQNPEWAYDMQERAYACHVLALAGRPDSGWNARLRELAPRLSFAAQAHTAAALLLSGEPRQAAELIGRMGLPATREREIGGLLNSDIRDAALLLSAWLELDPENEAVAKLADYLDRRQTDGHWGNTQDNAMALLALGKYAQRVPADRRPFTGYIETANGRRTDISNTQEVRMVFSPGEAGAITVVNNGPGLMRASVRIEGISRTPAPEEDHGLIVRRAFLDMYGQPMDPSKLAQGDLVIVNLQLDPAGRALDNIAIEELLPAGWEIENPNLATAQQFDWITEKSDWCQYRDIRDDRLLLFSGPIMGKRSFYYAARAVTVGAFSYPAATAACMYEPEIRSTHGGMSVEVAP